MASSMCLSSDFITDRILFTTWRTSGGRLQFECSKNLATKILVSLYALRSTKERGRSFEAVRKAFGFKWKSIFLESLCFPVGRKLLKECWQAEAAIWESETGTKRRGGKNIFKVNVLHKPEQPIKTTKQNKTHTTRQVKYPHKRFCHKLSVFSRDNKNMSSREPFNQRSRYNSFSWPRRAVFRESVGIIKVLHKSGVFVTSTFSDFSER